MAATTTTFVSLRQRFFRLQVPLVQQPYLSYTVSGSKKIIQFLFNLLTKRKTQLDMVK